MSSWLEVISTTVTTMATGAAVIIAGMGLSTWKEQIKWQTDHELARRLLVEMYRFRDAVAAARSPFIWAHELIDENEEGRSFHRTPEQSHADRARAFQRRYAAVGESGPQLYALLLEAQAVWGSELSTRWKKVNRLQNELSSQVQLYLDYTDPKNQGADLTAFYADTAAVEAAKKIVHSIGEADGENEFSLRFSKAFEEVEDYLRKKLGRKPE